MTDKEFKRLSRSQLIEIIYQLQIKQEELIADNERLSQSLADKRIRVDNTGNIAEAALGIHNVLQAAQNAAEHYLKEIQIRANDEHKRILKEAQDEAAAIIAKAQKEAAEITSRATAVDSGDDLIVEAILREWQKPF